MKYTRYCFPSILLQISLFCVNPVLVFAQEEATHASFDQVIEENEYQLEQLADSLITELNSTVNFSVSSAPLAELIRGVAESNGVNIAIDPNISYRVTNTFTNVSVKDLLLYLCKEYRLEMRFINKIIALSPYQQPAKPYTPKTIQVAFDKEQQLLSMDFHNDTLSLVVKRLTQETGYNILVMPEIASVQVNGFIESLPLKAALEKLALVNGLKLKQSDESVFVFEGQPNPIIDNSQGGQQYTSANRRYQAANNGGSYGPSYGSGDMMITPSTKTGDSLLNVDASNTPILDIIRRGAEQLGVSYVIQTEIQGNSTCHLQGIAFEDLLTLLLQPSSNYAFSSSQGIFLIGDKKQEGLRDSEVIKLQFRTVEEIDKIIPAELVNGLDLKIFKDLNAIVVSGSMHQLKKLKKFILLIDEPVPNILIEVIVADLRKGFSIQTGLSAFLSDSTVKTGGQVFPGVDVTLSSGAINDALDRWATNGWVNLGRVTPRFYATLEALEQNNQLDLRSTPKLSTLNGHEANLKIGNSVYYKVETQNVSGGVNPIVTVTPNFEKVEANLDIKINPIVSGNDHITLDITAEFSDFISPEVQGAPPGNATRKFTSKIRIRNEEMIILGGLEETRKSESGSGTPILSKIPILKWIFSRKVKEDTNNQLIVFIKPTIVY